MYVLISQLLFTIFHFSGIFFALSMVIYMFNGGTVEQIITRAIASLVFTMLKNSIIKQRQFEERK